MSTFYQTKKIRLGADSEPFLTTKRPHNNNWFPNYAIGLNFFY
nr:MAG TPA: hypothetical protein [Caudoviricetes sp.]